MESKEELRNLLKNGERINLECKESSNQVSKDVWETYSAFANTYGGTILLGIKENPKDPNLETRFTLNGVKNSQARIKDFWDTINSDKVNKNILLDRHVRCLEFDDKQIVLIEVPQATYKQKPVFINGNPFKGTFRRNFEGDYHCTEEEVRAMLRDSSDEACDTMFLENYDMNDIDLPSLHAYRNEFETRNRGHVWNSLSDQEFLRNLGGYIKDRKSQKEGLTAAGLLMFGKGLSIRERFDNLSLDYIDQSSLSMDQRWSDRLSIDGTWENNLYTFVKTVLPKLMSDLKKPFQMSDIIRMDDTDIRKSIREAFINMIIHADYQRTGQLKAVKYDDGFLFSNPGNLKLPPAKIFEGGYTAPRNPKLQIMFRMIGYCENIGSGFPTILNTWRTHSWRQPDLYDSLEMHLVELRLWMISTIPQEDKEILKSIFGGSFDPLSDQEKEILFIALTEDRVDTSRLFSVLKSEMEETKEILENLKERGFLIRFLQENHPVYALNRAYQKKAEPILSEKDTPLSLTDQQLIELLHKHSYLTHKMIIQYIDSINTTQGAINAMNRLIKFGRVQKEKEKRKIIYKLR